MDIDVLRVALNLAFDAGKVHQCAEETNDPQHRKEYMERADRIMSEAWEKFTWLEGDAGDAARAEHARLYSRPKESK